MSSTPPEGTPPLEAPLRDHRNRCPRCRETIVSHGSGSAERPRDPAHAGQWFESHATVRHHTFTCANCHLVEVADTSDRDALSRLLHRWEDDRAPVTWADVDARWDRTRRARDEAERMYTWPAEPMLHWSSEDRDRMLARGRAEEERSADPPMYWANRELYADVVANPDDDAPRLAYAAWRREQPRWDLFPLTSPGHWIEADVRKAQLFREDPKADASPLFSAREGSEPIRYSIGNLDELRFEIDVMDDIATDLTPHRGFIEHVAMKAKYFLWHAEELFRRAPIRHLTLTYCADVIHELAASPYLARIRSLSLPNRIMDKPYTRLNELTDDHVAVLAASPHLRNLAWLSLEDNTQLTPRAFDHLAMSPHLCALSYVQLDQYDYSTTWGKIGGQWGKKLCDRRSKDWAEELEARHGYLPWLHPEEHYGMAAPDFDRVVAHPVGDRAFRPDVAARRRPEVPSELADALRARVDTGAMTIVDRALVAAIPSGRLVATIERVAPDPDLAGDAALVTFTVQQAPATALALFDHERGRVVDARARETLTVRLPIVRPRAVFTPRRVTLEAFRANAAHGEAVRALVEAMPRDAVSRAQELEHVTAAVERVADGFVELHAHFRSAFPTPTHWRAARLAEIEEVLVHLHGSGAKVVLGDGEAAALEAAIRGQFVPKIVAADLPPLSYFLDVADGGEHLARGGTKATEEPTVLVDMLREGPEVAVAAARSVPMFLAALHSLVEAGLLHPYERGVLDEAFEKRYDDETDRRMMRIQRGILGVHQNWYTAARAIIAVAHGDERGAAELRARFPPPATSAG